MRRSLAAVFALALSLSATPAFAQMQYGGYDIGPDYGAMLDEALRRNHQFTLELQERERQVTEQAMADPECRRLYEAHQQQGGQLPYPNFAYLCWATQYFTPGGIAYFQQTEQDNWKKEHLALIDLRKMEAIRGGAQNDLNTTIGNNLVDLGTTTADRDAYYDPWSSQTVYLPQFSQPNQPFWDQQTQRYYTMDAGGTYLVWNGNAWQPIQTQPRR
jgi:hypothetical protein